jgi:hypothetical protein
MRWIPSARALLLCAITQACGDAPAAEGADTTAGIDADAGPVCADADAGGASELTDPAGFADPDAALDSYRRARTAAGCTVPITRRGKPLTIEYSIH